MRRVSFLLLFLLLGSLLAAAPVRAETSYYALSFDGEDDYVRVSDSEELELSEHFTVVAIVKPHSFSEDKLNIILTKGSSSTLNYRLNLDKGRIEFRSCVNGSVQIVSTSWQVTLGTTYFIAGVFDSSVGLKLYVDGELEAEKTVTGSASTSDTKIFIGSASAISQLFNGEIYLVLIYNRALSDSEIQAIYNDPLHPPTDGLVLWLAPDSVDTAQNKWLDKSGNGNDGTIVGASYVPLRPVSESTPSQSSPYALRFNEAGYVELPELQLGHKVTFVAIAMRHSDDTRDPILSSALGGDNLVLWTFGNSQDWEQGYARLYFSSSSSSVSSGVKLLAGSTYFLATSIDVDADTAVWYVNGDVTISVSYQASNVTKQRYCLGKWGSTYSNMTLYYFMIYNRILSDSEIQQIYENPSNPPLDGLVLWLDPYSYDPETGKWLNRAPIFPTIPLVEELDGVNYGATAERVSIPSLSVYDAVNGTPISPLNVSLSMLYNNTTTGLIPTLPVLPYNETVTLNVSATGYYPRLLTTWTGIDSLAVYLEPINQTIEEPDVQNFNTTLSAPQEFSNFNPNFIDFEAELRDIFTGRYGMLVAALMVVGLVVASLKFHQNPMTSATVLGVAVVYIGSWAYVNWGWLYTLVMMLISAGIMRAFGRWREV